MPPWTETKAVAGTPMYMAPEQAIGGHLDGRADLFSLGSVLYAVYRAEPFLRGSPLIVLRQVCEHTPTPVRHLNPMVPLWLAAIVARLHARQPAERFDNAAIVADLFRYNLAHPDSPRIVPPPRSAAPLRRKRVGLLMLTVLSGVLLVSLLPGDGPPSAPNRPEQPPALAPAVKLVPLVPRATLEGHGGPVWSVAFSPDGKTLVTGCDTALHCWDTSTTQETKQLGDQQARILGPAYLLWGQVLVSVGGDGRHPGQGDVATEGEIRHPAFRRQPASRGLRPGRPRSRAGAIALGASRCGTWLAG